MCVACCLAGCDAEEIKLTPEVLVDDQNRELPFDPFISQAPPMTADELAWVAKFNEQLSLDRDSEIACDCTLEVLSVEFDNSEDVDAQLWISSQSDDPNCPIFFIAGNNRFPNCNFFPNNTCVEHDPMTSTAIKDDGTQGFNELIDPGVVVTTDVQYVGYASGTTCGIDLEAQSDLVRVSLRIMCNTTDQEGEIIVIPDCENGTPPAFPGPQATPNNEQTIEVYISSSRGFGRFVMDDCCRPHWIQQ